MSESQQNQQLLSSQTIYLGYGSNLWLHQMRIRCPSSTYLGVARLKSYKWIINDRGYANVVEIAPHSSTKTAVKAAKEVVVASLASAVGAPGPSGNALERDEGPAQDVSISNCDSKEGDGKEGEEEEEEEEEEEKEGGDDESDYSTTVYGLVFSLTPADEARLDVNEGVPIAYTKEHIPCDLWASSNGAKVDVCKPPTRTLPMLVYIDRVRTEPSTPRDEYVYRMNRGIEDAVAKGVPVKYVEDVMRPYIPRDKGDGDGDKKKKEVEEFAEKQARRFEDESGVY